MRLSAEDKTRIENAARRDNRTVSAWLRHVSLVALEADEAAAAKRSRGRRAKLGQASSRSD